MSITVTTSQPITDGDETPVVGYPQGQPYAFTYFGQRIRLYPVPGPEFFLVRIQATPNVASTGADDAALSSWFTNAYDMIKARAKYILYKDTLKDPALASEALNDFNDQYRVLKAETSRRNGRGFITVTCF